MRKGFLRAACAALCTVLLVCSALPRAQGATVYFMAVNDTLMELSADTMPATVNRTLYVPYTMLSARLSGVNLGVYASCNSAKSQALVYSSEKQLIFEINGRKTYDGTGKTYTERAIMRNSMVYLPIALVCQVFEELEYTLSSTDYGYLVRVTNSSAVLEDDAFINAAANMMSGALTRYRQENPEADSPTGTRPGGIGSGAAVYPAFLQEEEKARAVADVLDGLGLQGLFLFTPEQLRQGAAVRRLIGTGHLLGLCLDGENQQERRAQLEEGRSILASVAHCRLSIVYVEQPEEGELEALSAEGVVCWSTTVDAREAEGSASRRAQALMRQMKSGKDERNYLLFSDRVWEDLNDILSAISREGYQFRTPVATRLS